ncbi:MAG: hypothetical protein HN368_10525 [Spirochaetales bacterium]|jgi:hypothetical protein|nr:hypothetical protein [Spirochaetales bacterium]
MITIFVYVLTNAVPIWLLSRMKHGFRVLFRFTSDSFPGKKLIWEMDAEIDEKKMKVKIEQYTGFIDRIETFERKSRNIYLFFCYESIAVIILAMFGMKWLGVPRVVINIIIGGSTIIHIIVLVFIIMIYKKNSEHMVQWRR